MMEGHLSESIRSNPYEGPHFDEYCISEAAYLSSHRDRTPCRSCALENLCEAGFEEQQRLAALGMNPSLTDGVNFDSVQLQPVNILIGLTAEQRAFVSEKIPGFREEE